MTRSISEDATKKIVHIVLDTDTYNEVDDQFALAYAILSPDRIKLEACYAAPFYADDSINDRSTSPVDGMEKSYNEIVRILGLMGQTDKIPVFRGSKNYLPNPSTPVQSEAVDDLIKRAMADRDAPLYVVAIAAITNIASAILKEPKIIDRIVVIWLGGHPHSWHTANEFNLMQDLAASQLIFNCGVPLVHVPCKNVAEHLRVSLPELKSCIGGKSKIGDYLCGIFEGYQKDHFGWSKEIWDVANIAYLVNPKWVPTERVHSPILTDKMEWAFDNSRHFIEVAKDVNRNATFKDIFTKLNQS